MKPGILAVPILLQTLLLTNCGYFQPVNGESILPIISTSPIMEASSSFSNSNTFSSISVTPSFFLDKSSSLESVEMSPSSDLGISSTSSFHDSPNNINLYSSTIFETEYSITPSETSVVAEFPVTSSLDLLDMTTRSDIIDSSPYPASSDASNILLTSSIDTDQTNNMSLTSSSFDNSDTMRVNPSSIDISPTQTITTDFAMSDFITTDSSPTDSSQTDSSQTDSSQTDSSQTDSSQTDSSQTDSSQTDSPPTDSPPTDSPPTDSSPTDINANKIKTTSKNLDPTTVSTPGGNHTLKSSMSKSSKVAAGICVPLAILAILGLTYFFYRRHNQDRSVKFTDGGSTWSYANASFADDAIKTSAQRQ